MSTKSYTFGFESNHILLKSVSYKLFYTLMIPYPNSQQVIDQNYWEQIHLHGTSKELLHHYSLINLVTQVFYIEWTLWGVL